MTAIADEDFGFASIDHDFANGTYVPRDYFNHERNDYEISDPSDFTWESDVFRGYEENIADSEDFNDQEFNDEDRLEYYLMGNDFDELINEMADDEYEVPPPINDDSYDDYDHQEYEYYLAAMAEAEAEAEQEEIRNLFDMAESFGDAENIMNEIANEEQYDGPPHSYSADDYPDRDIDPYFEDDVETDVDMVFERADSYDPADGFDPSIFEEPDIFDNPEEIDDYSGFSFLDYETLSPEEIEDLMMNSSISDFDDDSEDREAERQVHIQRLPTIKYKKNSSQTQCCICCTDFKENEDLRILPCLHMFHEAELLKWLERSYSCPICKTDIRCSEVEPEDLAK